MSRRTLPPLPRWIRVSGTPVRLGTDGRVAAGGPHRWKGVCVRDLAVFERRRRRLVRLDCHRAMLAELRKSGIRSTFASAGEAAAIIRATNVGWFDALDPATVVDLAADLSDRRGRKGKDRKVLFAGDVRGLGGNRRTSWDKILRAIMPRSRRWADVPRRLQELHDEVARSTDGHVPMLDVPEGVYRIEEIEKSYADCDGVKDGLIGQLLDLMKGKACRGGKVRKTFDLSDVPF